MQQLFQHQKPIGAGIVRYKNWLSAWNINKTPNRIWNHEAFNPYHNNKHFSEFQW